LRTNDPAVLLAFCAALLVAGCSLLVITGLGDFKPDGDPDGDGLVNIIEFNIDTDPTDPDTDGDGAPDGWEYNNSLDPSDDYDGGGLRGFILDYIYDHDLDFPDDLPGDFDPGNLTDEQTFHGLDVLTDPDDDSLTNLEEYLLGTDPLQGEDSDGDGMPDGWEIEYDLDMFTNDSGEDPDSDGLTNFQEYREGSDPKDDDTDDDGMPDGWETNYGDGWTDENGQGGHRLDPAADDASQDSDSGGVSNIGEMFNGTNPFDTTDDFPSQGNPGGGNGGSGVPGGSVVSPDTGSTNNSVTLIEVFDPPLGALKRWQIVDAVAANWNIYLHRRTREAIRPREGDYNLTYLGILNVTLVSGEYYRIPSVSPDTAIISYYLDGEDVEFYRDGAENFYIRTTAEGEFTFYFSMGTSGNYSGNLVMTGMDVSDVPPGILLPVPGSVQENVSLFLRDSDEERIRNLAGETDIGRIVTNLSGYFRNFTTGDGDVPDPGPGESIYYAIAMNKIGVCRHRAFAFMVTANALGLPTRYVANEVHAFVEVYVPEAGSTAYNRGRWMRVDLGGGGSIAGVVDRPDAPGMEDSVVTIDTDGYTKSPDKGGQFYINGTVTNLTGGGLSNHPVELYFGEDNITGRRAGLYFTNSSGVFNISIPLPDWLPVGPNHTAIHARASIFNAGNWSDFEPVWVNSGAVLQDIIPDSVGNGSTLSLAVRLVDMGGLPVPGAVVNFSWDGKRIHSNQTGDNGDVSYEFLVNDSIGHHIVLVEYNGSTFIGPAMFQKTVAVNDIRSPLLNVTGEREVVAGGSLDISGNITDHDGKALVDVGSAGNLTVYAGGPAPILSAALGGVLGDDNISFTLSFVLPADMGLGNNTLVIRYVPSGTAFYPQAQATHNITVIWILSFITDITPENGTGVLRGGTMRFKGRLDSNSTMIPPGSFEGMTINLSFAGSNHTTLTGSDGSFTFTVDMEGLALGSADANFSFNGSNLLSPSFARVTYVIRSTTGMTLASFPGEGEVYRNTTISISGALLDDGDTGVGSRTIKIWIDNELFPVSPVTGADGKFSMSYPVNISHSLGPLKLSFSFEGDSIYEATTNSMSFTVWTRALVDIADHSGTVFSGGGVYVTGRISDEFGAPLGRTAGQEALYLDFYGSRYFGESNESGRFNITAPTLRSMPVGEYDMTVGFTESYYNATGSTVHVRVMRTTGFVVIVNSHADENEGKRHIYIEGHLRDVRGRRLDGRIVYLNISGNTAESQVLMTDENGEFFYDLNGTLSPGSYNISLEYAGEIYYGPAARTEGFILYAATRVSLEREPRNRTRDSLWLNLTLTDDLGLPLPGMEIEINMSGGQGLVEEFPVVTDGTGSVSRLLNESDIGEFPPPVGPYDLNALFPGRGYYISSVASMRMDIISPVTIVITHWSRNITSGGELVINGSVTDDLDAPVNTRLDVILQGSTLPKPIEVVNGIFAARLTVPGDAEKGDHTLFCNLSFPYRPGAGSYYTGQGASVPVHVSKGTSIVLDDPGGVLVRGRESNISGTLLDNEDHPMEGFDVELVVAGGNHTVITGVGGAFNLVFTPGFTMPLGPLEVRASYNGSGDYEPCSVKAGYFLHSTLEIVLYGGTFYWDRINISGEMLDDRGEPPSLQGEVEVLLGGTERRFISLDGACFLEDGIEFGGSGNITLTVSFNGSDGFYYLPAENSTVLKILSRLVIRTEPVGPVMGGDMLYLNGSIRDENGSYVKARLRFDLMPVGLYIVRDFYDSRFEVTWPVLSSLPAGRYQVRIAQYDNESSHLGMEPQEVDVTIRQHTETEVNASWSRSSGTIAIRGNVFHRLAPDLGVVSGNVTLFVNGKEATRAEVGDGYFSYTYPVEYELGEVVIGATYNENTFYGGSENVTSTYIKSSTALTLTLPESGKTNSTFYGSVTLVTDRGTNISNATIVIEIYDSGGGFSRTITISTDIHGTGEFSAELHTRGALNVEAIFNGSALYFPSSDSGSIKTVPDENGEDGFTVMDLLATASPLFLIVTCIVFGVVGWKRYKVRAMLRAIEEARLQILRGADVGKAIIEAYNQMCHHLAGYNLRRKPYDTVEEFKNAVRSSIRLSEDGIGSLTALFEIVDYGKMQVGPEHKEFALELLGRVEGELNQLSGGEE